MGVLGPVHRRPGTPPPPRRERPRRVSTAPGEPGRLHERAAPHTWPRRPHTAMAPRRVTGSGCLAVADERRRNALRPASSAWRPSRRPPGTAAGTTRQGWEPGSSGSPWSRPAATLPQACTALDCSVVLSAWGGHPHFHPHAACRQPDVANLNYQLGNLCRPGLSCGLTCGKGCPIVTVSDRFVTGVNGTLMARRSWLCLLADSLSRTALGVAGHGGRQAYGQFAGIGASRDGCCCCCQRACGMKNGQIVRCPGRGVRIVTAWMRSPGLWWVR